MVTTTTLNRKINNLRKEVKYEKEILKREKAAIRKEVKQGQALIKKEKAILKKVKAEVAKDKVYIAKQSKNIREMYEVYADENMPKYILKPFFWIDVMLKAVIMGLITYLSYKGMNHSQFTHVKVLVWKHEKEADGNKGLDVNTWSNKIENSPKYKSISLADDGSEDINKDHKTYLVSDSPIWKIILDLLVQIFMRIIFAVVIKVAIKGFFNQFDYFDNKVSTKAWSAVIVVSSIIVTYSSEELTDKINLLFGQISLRN